MIRRTKSFILLAFSIAISFSSSASETKMSPKDILTIESNIALPKGAHPIATYSRYYYITDVDGLNTLIGYYLNENAKNPGVHWAQPNSLPMMADGGCRVVHIEYDLINKKLLKSTCNGEA